jgi:hypothetical protein
VAPIATTIPARGAARTGARLGVMALALATTLAACASEPPEPLPDVTVTPAVDVTRAAPPEPTIPLTWPLTGVQTAEVANRPAVAVKIENTSQARPQGGLEAADVVWETIVEFEVSRLVAVYHSQLPEEIGPIRSVRPMDMPIASPLRGLIVFSGGQAGILNLAANSPMQVLSHDAGADGLYRVSRRSAPHNVYGSLTEFVAQADADHAASPAQQFQFALRPALASAVRGGTPATTLAFRLSGQSRPSWSWDAGSGTWFRSEGDSPAMAESGARLSAVNVVSITASHPDSGFNAQNNAPVPTYVLEGEGDGVLATGGMTSPVRWSKAGRDEPLQLLLPDGSPAMLAPGNTWVELVPAETGSLTIG